MKDEPALRASDAEREQMVELLRRHAVDGRLTLEEFARRIDQAYEARTRDELDELVQDLPAEPPQAPSAWRWEPTRSMLSILGGTSRRGRFPLAKETTVVAILGGVDLDLREAELEAPQATITIFTLLGGAQIVVPEGIDVELTGVSLLGGRDYRRSGRAAPPGAPRVHVRAFSLLGGIAVRTKPSGE